MVKNVASLKLRLTDLYFGILQLRNRNVRGVTTHIFFNGITNVDRWIRQTSQLGERVPRFGECERVREQESREPGAQTNITHNVNINTLVKSISTSNESLSVRRQHSIIRL